MKKRKPILLFICMLILFAGWIQVYLLLSMGSFGFADLFFYSSLILTFSFTAVAAHKKRKIFLTAGILCLLVILSVQLGFNRIENYYFDNAVSKGTLIKADLKRYHDTHKVFPENLKSLYFDIAIPKYKIGLIKYDFGYYKTDTGYSMSFNLFEARMFCNKGAYNSWVFCD